MPIVQGRNRKDRYREAEFEVKLKREFSGVVSPNNFVAFTQSGEQTPSSFMFYFSGTFGGENIAIIAHYVIINEGQVIFSVSAPYSMIFSPLSGGENPELKEFCENYLRKRKYIS